MCAAWPRRAVQNEAELRSALADAPRDRTVLIEVVGSISLDEHLVINRPVVLVGSAPGAAELRGAPGAEAAISIGLGGEGCALRWLSIRLQQGNAVLRAGGSCVDVSVGHPTFVECDFNGLSQANGGSKATLSKERTLLTHAVRVSGQGVSPLLAGCVLHDASGVGILVDRGATAALVQCELTRNRQGGCFVGDGACILTEDCKIYTNGHFGVVLGPSASQAYLGRTQLTGNMAGSVWHCGYNTSGEGNSPTMRKPTLLWLDQCSLSGPGMHAGSTNSGSSGPAVVIGPMASAVLWESTLQHQPNSSEKNGAALNGSSTNGKLMLVRVEATARAAIASNGPLGGWPGWAGAPSDIPGAANHATGIASLVSGVGSAVMIDISGEAPPVPAPPPMSPKAAAMVPPSYSEKLWRQWESPQPTPAKGMPISPMQTHAMAAPQPVPLQRAGTAPSQVQRPRAPTSPKPEPPGRMSSAKSTAPAPPPDKAAGLPDIQTRMEKVLSCQGHNFMAATSPFDDTDRITLYQILAMLVVKYKCKEALDTTGLGGPLRPKDTVRFRGHTGRWIVAKDSGEVVCNGESRESSTPFILEPAGRVDGNLQSGNVVSLAAVKRDGGSSQQLGILQPAGEVRLVALGTGDSTFVIDVESATRKAYSGMPLFLKGKGCQKNIDVQTETVNARVQGRGTLQRINLDKIPAKEEIPEPAPDRDFSEDMVCWLLRRGAQFGLLDRQPLAAALSNHKGPAKDLLKSYTKLWKDEWKTTVPPDMFGGATASGGRRISETDKRGRARSTSTWLGMFSGGTGGSPIDIANGDLFMMALRSYFATAIRMSQLEADCVQRVIEAFASALGGDDDFMKSFRQSMAPESERKVYKNDDDCIFGLAYMTIMLNTDAHNSQVAEKTWDLKRFTEGGGRDCGMAVGLMAQIFKLVAAEEL